MDYESAALTVELWARPFGFYILRVCCVSCSPTVGKTVGTPTVFLRCGGVTVARDRSHLDRATDYNPSLAVAMARKGEISGAWLA